MSIEKISPADMGDRHRSLAAFSALALSGHFAISALEKATPASIASFLHWLAVPMAVASLLLVLPIVFWKLRNRGSQVRSLYKGEDGFVAEAINKAHVSSWSVTLMALALFNVFGDRLYHLPPQVLSESLMAIMLAVLSLGFLFFNRSEIEDRFEESR